MIRTRGAAIFAARVVSKKAMKRVRPKREKQRCAPTHLSANPSELAVVLGRRIPLRRDNRVHEDHACCFVGKPRSEQGHGQTAKGVTYQDVRRRDCRSVE